MAKDTISKQTVLCNISEISDLSCKSFTVKINRKTTDIFVVRKDSQVYAYQNSCPHARAPLEWNPDEFLDAEKKMIICALHGAKFSIEEGACLGGPCEGIGLTTVPIKISDGDVHVL